MKRTIDIHLKKISSLCEKYKVKKLFAFGSVLTDRFNANSDIDFLVDFDKERIEDYFDNFFDFKVVNHLPKLKKEVVELLEQ